MNFFLTGGTGFIGSHFLHAALAAKHNVVALRRHSSSQSVIPLPFDPAWCLAELNSLTTSHFDGIDVVVHLASAGVSPKQASWDELVEANVWGSLRLMQVAAAANVKRFVIAGTSHEYGYAGERYQAIPPDAPLEPQNAYGASKAAAFQLLRVFAREQALELFYGRIFSVYGEGQYLGNFWPSLRQAAISGEDFPMTSGRQISDFVPVQTVARHLIEACTRDDLIPGQPLVVNIGSGEACSLLSFAEREWHGLQATGSLLPGKRPERPGQIYRLVPDIIGLLPHRPLST